LLLDKMSNIKTNLFISRIAVNCGEEELSGKNQNVNSVHRGFETEVAPIWATGKNSITQPIVVSTGFLRGRQEQCPPNPVRLALFCPFYGIMHPLRLCRRESRSNQNAFGLAGDDWWTTHFLFHTFVKQMS